MNSKLSRCLSAVLVLVMAVFAGCKNGEPGPAGTAGTNGTNGTNGSNGTNGAGFDAAVKNGSIVVYLDGKRPDGVAFKDTLTFLFSPTDLSYSRAYQYSSADNEFYTRRYLSMDASIDSYADIDFEWETDEPYYYFDFVLKSSVSTPDHVYFDMNDEFYDDDGEEPNIQSDTFTSYSYDTSTGHVIYKFSFLSTAGNNDTGYDLNVSGIVNATVYQQIEEGRKSHKVAGPGMRHQSSGSRASLHR